MDFPRDLLAQAAHLAALDPTRPKQANLRRSISSAYYALFHLLVAEATGLISPSNPPGLAARIGRASSHAEMKQLCRSISSPHLSPIFASLLTQGFCPELLLVTKAFVFLQEARHAADYDTAIAYSRAESEAYISQADRAFDAWLSVRGTDEATVFLTALLLHKQCSR